jgi:hypothetical protein
MRLLLCAFLPALCIFAASASAGAINDATFAIAPRTTNSKLPIFEWPNQVAAPQGKPRNLLFLFLPGTGAAPRMYRKILIEASRRGFHAIGLTYDDGKMVNKRCKTSSDPACWGTVRREELDATRPSSELTIPADQAIVNRLTHLLKYLAQHDPSQGWGRYLAGGAPVWSKIVAGGHSQGAGEAAYMAKLYVLHGVCGFDSPSDGNARISVPAWLTLTNLTPRSHEYVFTNRDDELATWKALTTNARAIGLAGTSSVDGAQPPYGGAHLLYTTVSGKGFLNSHDYTVMDYVTPMNGATPVYAPVWDAACFT